MMIRFLVNVLHLAWTLWFGGMVILLIFVTRLFNQSHALGVDAAPVLFDTFAIFQLGVGAIACLSATVLTVITRRRLIAVCTLLHLIAFAAAIFLKGLTLRIDHLRLTGQTTTEQFKHLHASSGIAYVTAATALLIGGILFLNARLTRRTTIGTLAVTSSPAAAPR